MTNPYVVLILDMVVLTSTGRKTDKGCVSSSGRRPALKSLITGMESIHIAVYDNDLAEVMRMVEEDPEIVNLFCGGENNTRLSPLNIAALYGHMDVAEYLLDHGADIHQAVIIPDGSAQNGYTPLHLACGVGAEDMVEFLLGRGANPTITSSSGTTPLILASGRGSVECLRHLLEHDLGKTIIDTYPTTAGTALFVASSLGHADVVEVLLESGADPTLRYNHFTPLMMASGNGYLGCVKCLLSHDEGITTIDSVCDGSISTTALCLACIGGHTQVVKALLDSGADPTLPMSGGIRPVEGAFIRGHDQCVNLLKVSTRPCHACLQVQLS